MDGIKAWKRTRELERNSNDSLNNRLFDLKEKYKISDEDMLDINIILSLITTREISGKLGMRV